MSFKCKCGKETNWFEQGIVSGKSVCFECSDKEFDEWKAGAKPHPDARTLSIDRDMKRVDVESGAAAFIGSSK